MQADAPVLGIAPRTPIERPSPVASLHREPFCVISRPIHLATARVRGNVGMKDRPARVRNQRLRAACSPLPPHRPALTAAPERVAPLQARARVLLRSDHTMTGVAR